MCTKSLQFFDKKEQDTIMNYMSQKLIILYKYHIYIRFNNWSLKIAYILFILWQTIENIGSFDADKFDELSFFVPELPWQMMFFIFVFVQISIGSGLFFF